MSQRISDDTIAGSLFWAVKMQIVWQLYPSWGWGVEGKHSLKIALSGAPLSLCPLGLYPRSPLIPLRSHIFSTKTLSNVSPECIKPLPLRRSSPVAHM